MVTKALQKLDRNARRALHEATPVDRPQAGRRADAVESQLRRMRPLLTAAPLTFSKTGTALSILALVASAVSVEACSEPKPSESSTASDAMVVGIPIPKTADTTQRAIDAGVANALTQDAGTYDGPRLGALFLQTPVMSDMEWLPNEEARRPRAKDSKDKVDVIRLGYIRQGGRAPVIPEAHKKANCLEGWYELLAGGFVCGKYGTLDMNHPRVKLAPHAPDMTGSLPYQYGYNITNGTPLYRTIPSREDRLKFEPWLARKSLKAKRPTEEDPATNPYADADLDAGAGSGIMNASTTDPLGAGFEPVDAGIAWYLRDYDGGKPTVTLDELKGEGPMSRRMVKGFYLALDKEMNKNGTKWWQTTGSLLAPYDKIYVNKTQASEFHGIWLNEPLVGTDGGAASPPPADKAKLAQIGFVLWTHAHKYLLSDKADKKRTVTQGDTVARFTIVRLTGETAATGGYTYDETVEGWWLRGNEGTKTKPGPPPTDLVHGEKWVDVNLTNQTLVAFEGDKPVYATLVSTGKRNLQVKEKDHPTVKGTFRIREKHIAATMDGDVASDGPYSIEDVPWIMYFSGSYALHGAFWHNNFGHVQSHGCVNLSPPDAKAMFGWTEPSLPEGWHGVMATEDKLGSRVVVHD